MHECAPAFGIQVSFSVNQQLACLCVTTIGSFMQSGLVESRKENQKQIYRGGMLTKNSIQRKISNNFKT